MPVIPIGRGTADGADLRRSVNEVIKHANNIKLHRARMEQMTVAQMTSYYGFDGADQTEKEANASACLTLIQNAQTLTDSEAFSALATIV